MNALQLSIVHQYDELGMTIEEIAEEHPNLDPVGIKTCLTTFSLKYKQENSTPDQPEITDDEHRLFMNSYKGLALGAEDEKVRERALKFLINEKKGRNDVIKKMVEDSNKQVNFFQVNQYLIKARQAKQKALGQPIEAEVLVASEAEQAA